MGPLGGSSGISWPRPIPCQGGRLWANHTTQPPLPANPKRGPSPSTTVAPHPSEADTGQQSKPRCTVPGPPATNKSWWRLLNAPYATPTATRTGSTPSSHLTATQTVRNWNRKMGHLSPPPYALNWTALGPRTGGDEGTTAGQPLAIYGRLGRTRDERGVGHVVLKKYLSRFAWTGWSYCTCYRKFVILCCV